MATTNFTGLNLEVDYLAGGAAGDLTLTGIATDDTLLKVISIDTSGAGNAGTDLTSEFTITAANTINNTGGTSTANKTVIVYWLDKDMA